MNNIFDARTGCPEKMALNKEVWRKETADRLFCNLKTNESAASTEILIRSKLAL